LQTLYILAFGESVINDAVSIVLFESILSQYYINQVTYLLYE
jgi:NhaP-type Na+/H+ or K+/H+ antiporter